MRRRGSPLEIDDEDIVLDDQHLTKMEVAVVTDIQIVDVGRNQFAQAIAQTGAQAEQLVDQLAVRFPKGVAALLQRVEHALGAARRLIDPAFDVLGSGRFGREIGDLIAGGEPRCISATRLPVCAM